MTTLVYMWNKMFVLLLQLQFSLDGQQVGSPVQVDTDIQFVNNNAQVYLGGQPASENSPDKNYDGALTDVSSPFLTTQLTIFQYNITVANITILHLFNITLILTTILDSWKCGFSSWFVTFSFTVDLKNDLLGNIILKHKDPYKLAISNVPKYTS